MVCSIEFFPYRSLNFCHGAIRLPSQSYTFALVKERLASGALIIVTRGLENWVLAVPELGARFYQTVFRTKSRQNTAITLRNLPDGVFDRICERITTLAI